MIDYIYMVLFFIGIYIVGKLIEYGTKRFVLNEAPKGENNDSE